jgi:hypothetical protein
VVALLGLAGVAIAASGGGSKPVTLCADKASGDVFLGAKGKCGKGTKKLVVGQKGPAGAKGSQGAPGPAGAAGKPLALTQEPARQVGAAVGACAANPGTFCGSPDAIGTWESLLGPLTYRKDAAGWVHLTGGAKASTVGSETQFDDTSGAILFLPPGYRPTDGIHRFYISFSSCSTAGIISYVDVLPNGAVKPKDNIGCVGLSKVSFYP